MAELRTDPFGTVRTPAADPGTTNPNSPVIAPIADIAASPGQTISFTVQATSPVGAAVTFALAAGSPRGAAIDPNSGLFTWTVLS